MEQPNRAGKAARPKKRARTLLWQSLEWSKVTGGVEATIRKGEGFV
jgi:hypothetical protein